MIVNLIKSKQLFSVNLPVKAEGQYWITDIDSKGRTRNLISVEAVGGKWIAKSNNLASVVDSSNNVCKQVELLPKSFYYIRIANQNDKAILFSENMDPSRQNFTKIVVNGASSFLIGRNPENNICFSNGLVSGKHAKLSYDGTNWSVIDMGSTNGVFVNGFRVDSQNLDAGDMIYIMGLKIVVGYNFMAINNPNNLLTLNSSSLSEYTPQNKVERPEDVQVELPSKKFFFRSPRFHREVEHSVIEIDAPPQREKEESVPLALTLGPSMTMGIASLSSATMAILRLASAGAADKGTAMLSVIPSLTMAISMMAGTLLWPVLTKKHAKKKRIENEGKRQRRYLAYLDEIRDKIKRESKEQYTILNENLVSAEMCAERIAQITPNLWERVIGQSDFLRFRVGIGDVPLDAEIKFPPKKFTLDEDNLQDAMLSLGNEPKTIRNVPISLSFVDDNIVGFYGNYGQYVNLMKSIILQAVSLHSYDELKIMMITDETDLKEWEFVKWIPHFWDNNKTIRFLATNADEIKEISAYIEKNILSRSENDNTSYSEYSPYYIIISTSEKLQKRCEAIGQLLKMENNVGFTVVFLANELKDLPKETDIVVMTNGDKSQIFDKDDTTGKKVEFAIENINENILNGISEDIANIELDLSSQRYDLPNMITFLEMFHVSKIEHLNILHRWKENNPTITLQAPIGVDTQGDSFYLDLHEKYHGPHGLVAGMTGSGKSEFIITYILSLAVNYHPNEVAFILIDYKGGGLTGAFEDPERGIKLPHLAGTITNLDGAAIQRSLISIQSELRRRQAIFNEARRASNEGTMDIYKYQQLFRDKVVSEPVPHLFIISDEFAELKTQQPEFMEQLISTARIGRSLGVHLILATQKPSGVVDDQIWSNSKFRVCLKVQDKADSQDMIKRPDAAELSQTGRFYLQVGFNEFFALGQSAWCGAEYVPAETVEKTYDQSIQVIDNLGRVLMSVKPNKKKETTKSKVKQIVSIVKYLSDIAVEENIVERPLWLDPIPEFIYIDDLEKKYSVNETGTVLNPVVGEFDDPFNQKQGILTVPFSKEGNCLVYGAIGNGKTTFMTTLCYSLIKNHSVDELNLYIMDFGSETLKMFDKAPQVGGVTTASDEEKNINLFKMLYKEMDRRKALFADYGGDYASYCRNAKTTIPNIVVAINNYTGFAEQYENLYDMLLLLTRDGIKYGIYFIMTVSSTSGIRFRIQQNFKTMLTMQLNDSTEYSMIVGKTGGLIPSKFKGRGLAKLDGVFEFQTAYCSPADDIADYIRNYCLSLAEKTDKKAKRIPVLPDVVNYEYVRSSMSDLSFIPVGVAKKSLDIVGINMLSKVVSIAATQDTMQCGYFAEEFINVVSRLIPTQVIDTEMIIANALPENAELVSGEYDAFVEKLFLDMVKRNNTYKEAKMDITVLDQFERRVIVILGIKGLFDLISDDNKNKLATLIEKAEAKYKIHFFMLDSAANLKGYTYDPWYKRHVSGTDGVWIGDGIADQYSIKLNKVSSDLYEDIGAEYGYIVERSKPLLTKLLTSQEEQ